MALIKNSASEQLVREAVVLDFGDLRRQGEEMVSRAQARAAEIVAHAEAERKRLTEHAAEEGRRQGHAEGHAKGHAEGLEKGRLEALAAASTTLESLVRGWSEALSAFEGAREAMLTEARNDVLSLAVAIARKVTRRIAQHDPEVVRGQLAGAIGLLLRSTRLVIAVHPDDRAEAERSLPGILERLRESPHAELVDDSSLERGSCIVRTDHGEIDASIGTQLRRIVETLAPVGGALRDMPGAADGDNEGPTGLAHGDAPGGDEAKDDEDGAPAP